MKKIYITIFVFMIISTSLSAQKKTAIKSDEYRRGSLHTILVEANYFEMMDTVLEVYKSAPFPDKYNDHRLPEQSFNAIPYLREIRLDVVANQSSKDPQAEVCKIKDTETTKYMPSILPMYFEKNRIAKQLVAKWFSRREDGTFDPNLSLLVSRGAYNADFEQVELAKVSKRGRAVIDDAAEELIGSTFVVVHKMNFYKNEPVAALVHDIAISVAESLEPFTASIAITAADCAYEMTKDGYTVSTESFLYQLVWNDSISSIFFNQMWMTDSTNYDPQRKELFDNSNIFHLRFLGQEHASSSILISAGKGSIIDIVKEATVRNIDRCYMKLQKQYDEFKTKSPIISVEPLTARIGMKEGVEKGDRFEVLEFVMNPDGTTRYKTVCVVKASKPVWDNRYVLTLGGKELVDEQKVVSEEIEVTDDATADVVLVDEKSKKSKKKKKSKDKTVPEVAVDATIFKCKNKMVQPGMLLRQIK